MLTRRVEKMGTTTRKRGETAWKTVKYVASIIIIIRSSIVVQKLLWTKTIIATRWRSGISKQNTCFNRIPHLSRNAIENAIGADDDVLFLQLVKR